MAKKKLLQNNMAAAVGGLDNFFSGNDPEPKKAEKTASQEETPEPKEKEKLTRYNYVVTPEQKRRIKQLSIDMDMTLKEILEAALTEYLERHERK